MTNRPQAKWCRTIHDRAVTPAEAGAQFTLDLEAGPSAGRRTVTWVPAVTGMRRLQLFALAVAAGLAGTPVLADDAKLFAYGRHLARECTACHRLDGVDNGIASILGMDRAAFAATLGFYRSGARSNAAMVSVAQSLDDAQVEALAVYYASLPKPAAKADAKAKP